MKNKLASLAGAFALAGAGVEAKAADMGIGSRGPTSYQFDQRVSYSDRELNGNRTQASTGNSIFKYWNGNEKGIWAFLNVPFREVSNNSGKSSGLGDVSLGIGPRGRIDLGENGNLYLLSYVGLNLPTGDVDKRPALGNGRLDKKVGLFSTYSTSDKRFGLDISLEYNFTGENNLGVKPSDELSAGMIVSGKISDKWKFGTGAVGTMKQYGKNDGDHQLSLRGILRYDHSKKWHSVFILDKDVSTRNMPSGFNTTALIRYNF
ncbi:MAG: transporter [Nanoarchaeota archaeon]